jgi:hypothetical protein
MFTYLCTLACDSATLASTVSYYGYWLKLNCKKFYSLASQLVTTDIFGHKRGKNYRRYAPKSWLVESRQ